ncbi:glycerate kinase [Thiosulfativibrio zosterae]|uniref:Glycerate kinase n=1 Tax=Thiosulfativibrio zosterae TaxID=2675053 RepID=A0A6F8PNL8_9GAMM|nr:glycerate kinase [Thiosulfativibrio zosterae]BBP43709.1 glycerate kinase [Thiosulfativibrio zosterae]
MNPIHPQVPKTLLVAPDSFKGSLSAVAICQSVEKVVKKMGWPIQVVSRPMSDGGEGFVDAVLYAGLAQSVTLEVQNPIGKAVSATFAWQPDSRTAIVEMAQASGLPLLSQDERNPLKASSYGTGQLLVRAIEMGAKKIVLGLGGSATNDGGAGALQALGFQMLNSHNQSIGPGPKGLSELSKIGFEPQGQITLERLQSIEWVIACDVTNPLLGPLGATAVFGPQKGVTPALYSMIETSLQHFADLMERRFKRSVRNLPGAGAAGGMAGGFVGFLDAKLVSGFTLLADLLALENLFEEQKIDCVLTAEGKIDEQTQYGKLPAQIALMAQRHHVPCVAICGKLEASLQDLPMFKALHSIHEHLPPETPLEILLTQTPQNLTKTLKQHLPTWLAN